MNLFKIFIVSNGIIYRYIKVNDCLASRQEVKRIALRNDEVT